MAINTDSLNRKLYGLLKVKGYNPVPKDSRGQTTPVPDEAEVFKFTFTRNGQAVGDVWVTIDSSQNLIVYYDDDVADGDEDTRSQGRDFNDSWTGLIQHLKNWAQRRQLSFELKNKNHLSSDMAQRAYTKKEEAVSESKMNAQQKYLKLVRKYKLVSMVKTLAQDLLDKSKGQTDTDMRRMYAGDARAAATVARNLQLGNIKGARIAFSRQDTAARDEYFSGKLGGGGWKFGDDARALAIVLGASLNTRDEDDGADLLKEKAVSKAQQRFMGMVHAAQKGGKAASPEVAKVAKSMGKKDAKDFASTKHKGLPQHVKEGAGRCEGCGGKPVMLHPYHGHWCRDCLDTSELGGNRCGSPECEHIDGICKKHCSYCGPKRKGLFGKIREMARPIDWQQFSINVGKGGHVDYPTRQEYEERLEASGIPFRKYDSPYEGHAGFAVPKTYAQKARRILNLSEDFAHPRQLPDLDHMNGPSAVTSIPTIPAPPTSSKRPYTNYKQWIADVNEINSTVFDDMSDYVSTSKDEKVTCNGNTFAFWNKVKKSGWIDSGTLTEGAVISRTLSKQEADEYKKKRQEVPHAKSVDKETGKVKENSSDPLQNRDSWAKQRGKGQVYKTHYPDGDNPHRKSGAKDTRSTKMHAYDISRTGPKGHLPEQVAEGYFPLGKKMSYNDNVPTVKIILQHTRQIEEGEQRFRNIARIFLETANGERILAPTTKPGIARVYARHLAEGGLPHNDRWNHIGALVEEYTKMAGFVRATRAGQFNESAQQLVQEGVNHYNNLRETLNRMTTHRGYTAYFAEWAPVLTEESDSDETLTELFVQEKLDPRIECVMPILAKLRKNITETNQITEVGELAEWANTITEFEMTKLPSDSDDTKPKKSTKSDPKSTKSDTQHNNPSNAQTNDVAMAAVMEEESLTSNNPQGIPEAKDEDSDDRCQELGHLKQDPVAMKDPAVRSAVLRKSVELGCDAEIAENPNKVTDKTALKVKELAIKFFRREPYSSARIANGTIHRLSIPIGGWLSADAGGLDTKRPGSMDKISAADKKKMANLRDGFLKLVEKNGIPADKVDVKFHVGSFIYASIRTKISEPKKDAPAKGTSPRKPKPKVKPATNQEYDLLEGAMSEADIIIQDILDGTLDIHTAMMSRTDKVSTFVADMLQRMYDEIAAEHHLHPDDDFEQIEARMMQELEKQYGNRDETLHEGLQDRTEFASWEEFKQGVAERGLELEEPYADAENGPSPDDVYQTRMVKDQNGDFVGMFWHEGPDDSKGVIFNNSDDFYRWSNEGDMYDQDTPDGPREPADQDGDFETAFESIKQLAGVK